MYNSFICPCCEISDIIRRRYNENCRLH